MTRKTVLMFLVIFAVSTAALTAQTYLGIYGGANFANVSVDPDVTHDGSVLPVAGLLCEFTVASNLTVSLQPTYMQKGSVALDQGWYDEVPFVADYLSLPVMAAYRFDAGWVKPYVTAGFSVDFLLAAREKLNTKWYAIDDYVEKTDLTLNIGAGAMLPMGDNALFVELRYLHGLPNLNAKKGERIWFGPSLDFELMSRNVVALVGYKIAL